MMNPDQVSDLLYVVVFAPLLGAILNGLFSRYLSRRTVSLIGVGTPFISFAAALYCSFAFIKLRSQTPDLTALSTTLFNWISAGPVSIDFSLYFDPLSMVMTLIVTGVGSLIHLYSVGYMHNDPSYGRYFSHLNLFMFSMLLLVLGQNLLLLFVGWEGVGLCSYLLIGFWFTDMEKAIAGKKAFIVNRIGDFGFLLGLFVLVFWMNGSLDIPTLRDAVTAPQSRIATMTVPVTLVTLCLFLGATGKSAQIPLYVWLPDAMAGPTPVSALIHAATMVTAGVYMIARLNFLYVLSPISMAVVALTGASTALLAASIGLAQNDIKKILAYSTVSQLGYMFLGVGVGAFSAGIFHLMTHAFFKACLFLGAGSVIHAMAGEQNIQKMGGLSKKMPITRWTFLISCLAIAGIPGLSGFFSKDEILFAAFTLRHASSTVPSWVFGICFAMGLAAAFLTATYMFRLYFLTFSGDLRSHDVHPHESPPTMTIPLVVLAIGAVAAGWVGLPSETLNIFRHLLAPVFAWSAERFVSGGSHTLEYALMVLSSVVALAGIGLAWLVYSGPWRDEPERIVKTFPRFYHLVFNKYFVDELYAFLFVRPFERLASWTFKWIDSGLVDGVLVNGSARAMKVAGLVTRIFANGDAQAYAVAMFLGLVVLLWVLSGA